MTPILTAFQLQAMSVALQAAIVVALVVVGHHLREGLAAVSYELTRATNAEATVARLHTLCAKKGDA